MKIQWWWTNTVSPTQYLQLILYVFHVYKQAKEHQNQILRQSKANHGTTRVINFSKDPRMWQTNEFTTSSDMCGTATTFDLNDEWYGHIGEENSPNSHKSNGPTSIRYTVNDANTHKNINRTRYPNIARKDWEFPWHVPCTTRWNR